MIEEADKDGDGLINADEFYRVMRRRGADPWEGLSSESDTWVKLFTLTFI